MAFVYGWPRLLVGCFQSSFQRSTVALPADGRPWKGVPDDRTMF
jgi:hypothetical protein